MSDLTTTLLLCVLALAVEVVVLVVAIRRSNRRHARQMEALEARFLVDVTKLNGRRP